LEYLCHLKKMKMKKILFSSLLLLSVVALRAQTVDEVIDKYVITMGGKEKLAAIKSVYMEAVSVMQNGSEVSQKIYKVQEKLGRRDIDAGMFQMKIIVTPDKGWTTNPRNGGAFEPMPEERLKQMQTETDCTSPLFNYAAKGHKAELVGKEDVEGTECYKIKMTLKSGTEVTYFIDAKTNYLIRETRTGGGMMGGGGRGPGGGAGQAMNIDYSDYKTLDGGYVFATKVNMGGMMGTVNYEKIEVNKEIDVAALSKPE
jgi:outer membrane lipoprotein-sorting protein